MRSSRHLSLLARRVLRLGRLIRAIESRMDETLCLPYSDARHRAIDRMYFRRGCLEDAASEARATYRAEHEDAAEWAAADLDHERD